MDCQQGKNGADRADRGTIGIARVGVNAGSGDLGFQDFRSGGAALSPGRCEVRNHSSP